MTEKTPYNSKFYSTHKKGMATSAEVILGYLNQFYQPKKVVDIGCGQGNWLAVAKKVWNCDVTGYDGNWVNQETLADDSIEFNSVDLSDVTYNIENRFDLCISLEVAEHLPKERAVSFINMLTKTSSVILFSAAIPGQGGAGHINERWQSYWIKLFEQNGYIGFDAIRPKVWTHKDVEWWYKQNIFLFIKSDCSILNEDIFQTPKLDSSSTVDLIHPDHYVEKMRYIMHLQASSKK